MTGPAYPAARIAAMKVQPHFARHHAALHDQKPVAAEPDTETIEAIVGVAFWSSLRREEGYTPTVSIAYLRPDETDRPLTFEHPLPFAPDTLTKLGPAVERPGIHLGVWPYNGELSIWGTTRTIPTYCFVLEVLAPGLLVIKNRRGDEASKFVNLAVLQGDEIKVLNQDAAKLPDCPGLVTSLLGFDSPSSAGTVNILIQLAVSMRAHNRGGSLLVVPAGTNEWRESMLHPIPYPVVPAFSELADLMKDAVAEQHQRRWQEQLRRAVEAVAGLTAVDGATIITDTYELLAFGAKIGRRQRHARVEQVVLTEPVEGVEPATLAPTQLGGTRHLSAAQFVHDQRDSVALVASQDGHFTVFAWSPCADAVHAHRVETLLL
jgi:hypothetical protein